MKSKPILLSFFSWLSIGGYIIGSHEPHLVVDAFLQVCKDESLLSFFSWLSTSGYIKGYDPHSIVDAFVLVCKEKTVVV